MVLYRLFTLAAVLLLLTLPGARVVEFHSGNLMLHGVLYQPQGKGPFPALLFNHGSAPGMYSDEAIGALGPLFQGRGWVFFAPYRRGQGLSADQGPYIGDEVASAMQKGGMAAAAAAMIRVLEADQLSDQLAALAWLRQQSFVTPERIATFGNSFGGIEALLGAEHGSYCAAVDASGAAETWSKSSAIQQFMKKTALGAHAPVFFFQAENDYDVSPSRTLSEVMKSAGKIYQLQIYPAYGASPAEGHSFPYRGSSVWADDVFRFLDRYCRN